MNYYQPRQLRGPDGEALPLWHYTCQNGSRIWPVGACAVGCPGHPTAEEAVAHYRTSLLDEARYDGRMSNQQRRCRVCDTFTDGFAETGPGNSLLYVLCPEHLNRDGLDRVLVAPERMSASW